MKTRLVLLTLLSAVGFAAQACDTWDLDCNGRISADEARASDRANTAQNEANSIPPATTGLKPFEGNDDYGANQMGKWVKVSSTLVDWASSGEYGIALSPNALGKSCVKGSKGLLAKQTTLPAKKVCASSHTSASGEKVCHYYKTEPETTIADSSKGYRAECK